MNTSYDVDDWASTTTRGRQLFNYNYRMRGREIKGWKLLKTVTMQDNQDLTEIVYLWQSKGEPDGPIVRIDITERHNWSLAQQSLREVLSNSMKPQIPRGTKELEGLGDVSFVGREPQTDSAAVISFALGNLSIVVSNVGDRNIDLTDIAARLDQLLSEPPTKRAREGKRVRSLTADAFSVSAGEVVTLIPSIEAAAPDGEWLKIIVPDGELTRQEDALLYTPAQGGEKQVSVFAVSNH